MTEEFMLLLCVSCAYVIAVLFRLISSDADRQLRTRQKQVRMEGNNHTMEV